jgi:hypothetical protein
VNRHSKDGLDSRVAIDALNEADLHRLEQSKIPEETKKLDDLVPENGARSPKLASANVPRNPPVRGAFFGSS